MCSPHCARKIELSRDGRIGSRVVTVDRGGLSVQSVNRRNRGSLGFDCFVNTKAHTFYNIDIFSML